MNLFSSRPFKKNLQNAKKFRHTSQQWLRRQINDPFVHQAHADGYRSRSAFKLLEINAKFNLLQGGGTIIDLGAAPGGWSQVVARLYKERAIASSIIAIDLLPMLPIEGVTILQGDLREPLTQEHLRAICGGAQAATGILSDMAPSASGNKVSDQGTMETLLEYALTFIQETLMPGGWAILKVFHGSYEPLLSTMRQRFTTARLMRPKACRQKTSELYIILQGKKP